MNAKVKEAMEEEINVLDDKKKRKQANDDGSLPVQIAYDIKKEADGSLSRSNVRWQDADGNDLEPVEEGVANAILIFQAMHAMSSKKKHKDEEDKKP